VCAEQNITQLSYKMFLHCRYSLKCSVVHIGCPVRTGLLLGYCSNFLSSASVAKSALSRSMPNLFSFRRPSLHWPRVCSVPFVEHHVPPMRTRWCPREHHPSPWVVSCVVRLLRIPTIQVVTWFSFGNPPGGGSSHISRFWICQSRSNAAYPSERVPLPRWLSLAPYFRLLPLPSGIGIFHSHSPYFLCSVNSLHRF
jgi:hypothetical protein